MKRLFLGCLLFLLAVPAPSLLAQSLSAEKKEQIHREVLKMVEAKPQEMNSLALRKVFSPTFYKVEVLIHLSKQSFQTVDFLAFKTDSGFEFLETPMTNEPLPRLKELIKDDFRLKTQEDGNVFQEALKALFPATLQEESARIIKQDSAHWQFVFSKFFNSYTGFLVTTDDKGSIGEIHYSLKISGTAP